MRTRDAFVQLRPSLPTGICETYGCSLPAQPGREECSECIRNRIVGGKSARASAETRYCLDCSTEIDPGRNGHRVRCDACLVRAKNLRAQARYRAKVARTYRFPGGAMK